MKSILKCENLALGYNNLIVLDNISFEIVEGDYLYIIGDNGIGKSTLLKTILGLNKPIKGKITIKNSNTDSVGYLPQQTEIQKQFPATVNEIVLSAFTNKMKFRFWHTKQEKAIALNIMKELSIDNLKNLSFQTLSGGQKQRVLLARALCSTNKLLFLDEPNSGLDPETTKDFYNLLLKLNKDSGYTIVMVTHDVETVSKYASRVLCLHKGHTFFGTADSYQKHLLGDE